MGRRKALTQLLLDMMEAKLDGYMTGHGFSRRARSKVYKRVLGDTKQTLELTMSVGPRYARQADAHISPWLCIVMPQVNQIAVEMTRGGLRQASPDRTLRMQIESLAPPGSRPLWFGTAQTSFMDLGEPIRDFLDRWVMGFLDEYTTPEALVRGYEAGDDRAGASVCLWHLAVVASYVVLGRPRDAYQMLETHFTGIHTRRAFAPAFEYVRRLMSSEGDGHAADE